MENQNILKEDTKEIASNSKDITDNLNGGRTVVVRDARGETVMSSTYEEDTLEEMFKIAMKRHTPELLNEKKGPQIYHG